MVTNSVLRMFLMLSIFTILAGILLIVFNQFDRGYVFVGEEQNFKDQQRNLINHVYQTQVEGDESADNPLVMKLNKATVVIQSEPESPPVVISEPKQVKPSQPPAQPVVKQPAPVNRPQPVASNPWQQPVSRTDDYYTQLLRNNPWSPHYKPGY